MIAPLSLLLLLAACVPAAEPDVQPGDRESLTADTTVITGDREAAIEALRESEEARERDDVAGARRALDRAEAAAPGLVDWITVRRAEVEADAGEVEAADELILTLPEEMRWPWGWRARERARLVAGDTAAAAAVAEEAATHLGGGAERAAAFGAAASHRLALGDRTAGRAHMRAAADASPGSRAGLTAGQWLSEEGAEGAEDQRRIGEVYLAHGNVPRAARGMEAWIAAGGGTAEARADARFRLGMRAFSGGEHAIAERHLAEVARAGTLDPERTARALLHVGRAQYRAGRQDEGVRTFRRVPEVFPHAQASAHALFLLAGLSHEAGETARARADYQAAAETGADTEEAAVSAMRLAGMAIMNGTPQQALPVLEAYAGGDVSDGRAAAVTYWIGRLHLEAGSEAEARAAFRRVRERDPVSYYSALAGERLGEEGLPIPATGASPEITTPGWVEEGLFRFDVLRAAGLDGASTFEMARMRDRAGEDIPALYALAEATLAAERHVEGILVGREIRRLGEPWNPRLMRIVWPYPYREAIERHSAAHRLDPFMVAGLIRQESMFNANAVSPAGAIGLMQVMPGTAADLARGEGLGSVSNAELRDPELNIRLGTRFLAELLQRYDGRALDAFAAYNAGPARLRRWATLPEYADSEIFAERIPFDETRGYVKILQFNQELYETLYGG